MDGTENPTASANQELKAAWIKIVRHDDRFSVAEKYVLQNMAWIYPGNGILIYAKQTTIAHECGVSIRVVKSAYAKAKNEEFGYLVLENARKRGAGVHQPNTYRMVIPEKLGAYRAPNSDDELGARIDRVGCTARQSWVHETTELGARAEALTSDSDTIQGGEVGIEQGGEEGTAPPPALQGNPSLAALGQSVPYEHNGHALPLNHTGSSRVDPNRLVIHPLTWHEFISTGTGWGVPEEQPSRYCDKHPNDTDQPCIPCKRQGELLGNWESAYEQWREYNEFVREQIKECKYCCASGGKYIDESGQLWWCEHTEETSRRHETC
jgi:hypothetical protein